MREPPQQQKGTKEEVALLLPLFGIVLVAPPLINLFVQPVFVFGIPLETLYLFIVWLVIVLASALLSRLRLVRESAASNPHGGVAGSKDHASAEKQPGDG